MIMIVLIIMALVIAIIVLCVYGEQKDELIMISFIDKQPTDNIKSIKKYVKCLFSDPKDINDQINSFMNSKNENNMTMISMMFSHADYFDINKINLEKCLSISASDYISVRLENNIEEEKLLNEPTIDHLHHLIKKFHIKDVIIYDNVNYFNNLDKILDFNSNIRVNYLSEINTLRENDIPSTFIVISHSEPENGILNILVGLYFYQKH